MDLMKIIRINPNVINWDVIIHHNIDLEILKEFKDKIDWSYLSYSVPLSEKLIREFKDDVDWDEISSSQKLSERFIREFKDKVNWNYISRDQKLTQKFIIEFHDKLNINILVADNKISIATLKKIGVEIPKNNWYYKSNKEREDYIRENTNYEIKNGMLIAYKTTDSYGYSVWNGSVKYEVGKEYTAKADCNINNKNSYGLSAWTKEGALEYYPCGKLFKVGIKIKDIAAIIPYHNNKIRATKIKVLSYAKRP